MVEVPPSPSLGFWIGLLQHKDIAVVTQLYYQVYIIYQHQLHVSAIAALAIFSLVKHFVIEAIQI